MPEGDTIAYAARRMRPVLEGHVPDEIRTPHPRHAMDRWPERLAGRAVTEIRTHGKHLFLRFEGDLTIHSHLRMTGSWGVYPPGRRWGRSPRRAWLVLERGRAPGGPVRRARARAADREPDALRPAAGRARPGRAGRRVRRGPLPGAAARRRSDARDRRRAARSAQRRRDRQHLEVRGLLGGGDRSVAAGGRGGRRRGAGDHRRRAPADDVLGRARPRCATSPACSAATGGRARAAATRILARGQGDDNRTTFWCPGCQR